MACNFSQPHCSEFIPEMYVHAESDICTEPVTVVFL